MSTKNFLLKILYVSYLVICVASCVELPQPQIAYTEMNTNFANTAVIMNAPSENDIFMNIHSVNGMKMSCWAQGCPVWVRVMPGKVRIEGIATTFMPSHTYPYDKAYADVELELNVEAGHTYLIRSQISDGKVYTVTEDVGKEYKGGYSDRGDFYSANTSE